MRTRLGTCRVDEVRKLVTCTKIIDANRWIGVWHGQTYECRALPDTTYFSVGDAVLCHVLPGTSELVAVYKPQNETIYIGLNNETTGAELWEYNGSGVPTMLWALGLIGGDYVEIDSLCWCQATKSLFIGCYFYGNSDKLIYEWIPGDAAPTLRHTYAGENEWDAPIDWAEYKGKLYVMHTGAGEEPGYLCRFDPTDVAATFETVLTIMSLDENLGEGSFCVFDDVIFAMTSENIYYSTTGDSGSWTALTDLPDDHDCCTARGAVTDPTTGYGFFTAVGDLVTYEKRQVWRLQSDGTLTLEHNENCPDDYYGYSFTQIAIPYGDTNQQPLALQWEIDPDYGIPCDIYRRNAGGAWALEEQLALAPGRAAWVGANQCALFFQGKLHLLIGILIYPDDYHYYLYRRENVGNWTLVQDWEHYIRGMTYSYGGTMTLGKTSKYIQNI